MKKVELNETYIKGALSVEKNDLGLKPWRLPYHQLELFPAGTEEALVDKAERPAGIRLRFVTDTQKLTLVVDKIISSDQDLCQFDLAIDNQYQQTVEIASADSQINFDHLPAGEKIIDIWLPQFIPLTLCYLLIDDKAMLTTPKKQQLSWVTYGSSITHCRAAHSPAKTWPAIVARRHDLDLTCLGYGGQCHLDPMLARIIRDLPADLITLKLGINIYGAASLSLRTFKSAIIGFIQIIREKHPKTPIAVISPIYSYEREHQDNAVWYTLQKMRNDIADAVKRLITSGDTALVYYNGLELFNQQMADENMPDNLHPNGDGYELLAEKISSIVIEPSLKKQCASLSSI